MVYWILNQGFLKDALAMGIYLSLGSNLGERLNQLRQALETLEVNNLCQVCAQSSYYETAPWGFSDQPHYLNIAAEIKTALEPLEFLRHIKKVESKQGRKESERWGPRAIDIDIILWNDVQIDTSTLSVPHARFRERAFVLIPLAEIAPDAKDPVTKLTVQQLNNLMVNQHQNVWLYQSP